MARALGGPLVGLLEEDGADEPNHGGLVGKDPDHVGAALDLAVETLDRVCGMQLGAVSGGEVHVGEHVLLGGVHQRGELRHLRAELVGDGAPLDVGGGCVLLGIGGADPGRDDAPLSLARVRQRVAGEVDAAALPGGAQHLRHGCLQALMGVGDDELHARRAAPLQNAQEVEPEGLCLGAADGHVEDLAPPVGVDADRDGDRDRDDPPGLATFT